MKAPHIIIPPRLGYCASCLDERDDLRAVASEESGRVCWLCTTCRSSSLGILAKYYHHEHEFLVASRSGR